MRSEEKTREPAGGGDISFQDINFENKHPIKCVRGVTSGSPQAACMFLEPPCEKKSFMVTSD